MTRTSWRSVLLVGLLLLTSVAGPMSGTAAAAHECSNFDRAIEASVGVVGGAFVETGCDPHVDETIDNITAQDADQVRADVYSAANDEAADNEIGLTDYDNDLNSTDPILWMRMETEISRAYLNGSTQAESRNVAERTIEDGYSARVLNLIEKWNTSVSEVERLESVTDSEENVSDRYIRPDATPITDSPETDDHTWSINGFGTTTVVLPNGSTATARTIQLQINDVTNFQATYTVGPTTGELQHVDQGGDDEFGDSESWDVHGIEVDGPTESDETVNALTFNDYAGRWDRSLTQSDDLQAESSVFVNNTYSAYDSGEINASAVISRNTAMFELAADETSGNNSLYRSTAALAMMGLDTPELNSTGTMEVDYRQTEYNGLLLARNAPGGSWDRGVTYDTASLDGVVYLVTTSGEMITLDGEFTLSNITNEQGDQIDNVNHTQTTYTTANTSEFLTRQEAMELYRQRAEAREQAAINNSFGGGGAPIDVSPGTDDRTILIVALIGGGLVVITVLTNIK